MRNIIAAVAVVTAIVIMAVTACAVKHETQPISANATADAGSFLAATLCTTGGFDCETAPVYTSNALARRSAAVQLRQKLITVEQATALLAKTDRVRSLLDQSTTACTQDNKTGKCTGSLTKAKDLLSQAQAASL